jgi:hypothetical protein
VGISLTCDDKIEVASHLLDMGVAYIEGGYPGSNPKDVEFFARWESSVGLVQVEMYAWLVRLVRVSRIASADWLLALQSAWLQPSNLTCGLPVSSPCFPNGSQLVCRYSSGLAERARRSGTKLAAFGMTRRRGVAAADDEVGLYKVIPVYP